MHPYPTIRRRWSSRWTGKAQPPWPVALTSNLQLGLFLTQNISRYFSKLPSSRPIQRGSWGLEVDTPLFMPPNDPHEAYRLSQYVFCDAPISPNLLVILMSVLQSAQSPLPFQNHIDLSQIPIPRPIPHPPPRRLADPAPPPTVRLNRLQFQSALHTHHRFPARTIHPRVGRENSQGGEEEHDGV